MHELIATGDGSLTLRDHETGELYHNSAGAYKEALVNYTIPSGALERLKSGQEVLLLDVCFGLGYNTLVLIQEAINQSCAGKLNVIGIENDSSLLGLTDKILAFEKFSPLASALNSKELKETGKCSFISNSMQVELSIKLDSLIKAVPSLQQDFDFIFHDPFSPKRVPELWTAELFQIYFRLLHKREGAVLTYSSAGAVRGGLKEAGFTVKKTSALGGKTGGTLALINEQASGFIFEELAPDELRRCSGRSAIPFRNGNFSLNRESILALRQREQAAYVPRGLGPA